MSQVTPIGDPVVGNVQLGQPYAPLPDWSSGGSITIANSGPVVIWATAYNDMSSIVIHLSEIEALRYAVDNRMDIVRQVRPGSCLRDQLSKATPSDGGPS